MLTEVSTPTLLRRMSHHMYRNEDPTVSKPQDDWQKMRVCSPPLPSTRSILWHPSCFLSACHIAADFRIVWNWPAPDRAPWPRQSSECQWTSNDAATSSFDQIKWRNISILARIHATQMCLEPPLPHHDNLGCLKRLGQGMMRSLAFRVVERLEM